MKFITKTNSSYRNGTTNGFGLLYSQKNVN